MNLEPCYICGSDRFVENHHCDCQRGKISSLTVPLCKRCHRSYHIWGVGCFSPGTTLRAVEVENVTRRIYGEAPMSMADVERSSYWRKKWGIRKALKPKPIKQPFLPGLEVIS